MSRFPSNIQPVSAYPLAGRMAVYFETCTTHWTIMAFGMAVAAFIEFGVAGLTIGGAFFFMASLCLQRIAAFIAKPLTRTERAQVTVGEHLLFTFVGLMIPPSSMVIVILHG